MTGKHLLPIIGFIEFFERFGFYTMQGILVLFLIKTKHYSATEAYHIYGVFFALVYAFVGFGGWCGDKFLGARNTILLGLGMMDLGYWGLSLGSDDFFFPALSAVCIGNALFKANPANLLGRSYADDPQKLHAAFTLFYMSVNIGALLALIVGPFLSSRFNYHYAFGASALGLMLAMMFVLIHSNRLESHQTSAVKSWQWLVIMSITLGLWFLIAHLMMYYNLVQTALKVLISLVLLIYCFFMHQETPQAQKRLWAVLILMLEAVVFFTLYNQMPTSINLYAILHVKAEVFGQSFDPQSFQALNPLCIILWSPLLAKVYRQQNWSIFSKFAMGMISCGLSYLTLYLSHFFADAQLQISGLWLVFSYIFQSLGELLVSALGLAMVAELVPASWMGVVMGMWFLTSAVSGFTGAKLASYVSIPKDIEASSLSLLQFSQLFGGIAMVVFAIGLLMWLTLPWMEKLGQKM